MSKKRNKKKINQTEYIEKLKFMLQELNTQQQQFLERTRNCDVKLGFIIAFLSGILVYTLPGMKLKEIWSVDWIKNHNLTLFVVLLLIEISIITLLITAIIFAINGIKTKKGKRIDYSLYGEQNLKTTQKEILERSIKNIEKALNINIEKEHKKNQQFNISTILSIISIFLLIIREVLMSII